jgi:AraC-like DNA-binding protein
MAKFHFAHAFSDTYGVSPHHYLLMRRVEVARSLLRNGSSIVEASAMTGFADQAHLTRKFRAILGYTPGAWAQATRRSILRSIPAPC